MGRPNRSPLWRPPLSSVSERRPQRTHARPTRRREGVSGPRGGPREPFDGQVGGGCRPRWRGARAPVCRQAAPRRRPQSMTPPPKKEGDARSSQDADAPRGRPAMKDRQHPVTCYPPRETAIPRQPQPPAFPLASPWVYGGGGVERAHPRLQGDGRSRLDLWGPARRRTRGGGLAPPRLCNGRPTGGVVCSLPTDAAVRGLPSLPAPPQVVERLTVRGGHPWIQWAARLPSGGRREK